MNDAIDGMMLFNCGFKFQSAPHGCGHCKRMWGMAGQSSSAVGIDHFCYGVIIIER